jgi:hypothetical protein
VETKFQQSNKENNMNSDSQTHEAFEKLPADKKSQIVELRSLRREELMKKMNPARQELEVPPELSSLAKKSDEKKVAERVDLGLKRTGIWQLCGCEDEIAPGPRKGKGDTTIMNVGELRDYKNYLQKITDNKPDMVYVSLQHRKINDDSIKALTNALRCSTYVNVVSLQHNNITSAGCKQLGATLKMLASLKALLLGSNLIDDLGVDTIAKSLRRNYGLVELNLVGRKQVLNDFHACSGGIAPCPPRITAWGASRLANSLATHKYIKILSIGTQSLGDDGCRALATMVAKHETLEQLELDNNGIGAEGMRELGNALLTNKSLTFLNIAKNGADDEGFEALAKGLKRNKIMRVVDAAENRMGELGGLAMIAGISGRGSIPLRLLFHGNPVCDTPISERLAQASKKSEGAARTKFRKTAMSTMESLLELRDNHMTTIVDLAVEKRRLSLLASQEQVRVANETMLASRMKNIRGPGPGVQAHLLPKRRVKFASPRRRSVWKEQFVGDTSVQVLVDNEDGGSAAFWGGESELMDGKQKMRSGMRSPMAKMR